MRKMRNWTTPQNDEFGSPKSANSTKMITHLFHQNDKLQNYFAGNSTKMICHFSGKPLYMKCRAKSFKASIR